MKNRIPDQQAAKQEPGKIRRLNLGIGDGYLTDQSERPRSVDSYRELVPSQLTRRNRESASGLDRVRKQVNQSTKSSPYNLSNERGESQVRNNYTKVARGIKTFQRRESKRRSAVNATKMAKKTTKILVKSKGNPLKAAWDIFRDPEIRRLFWKYKFELLFAILGDIADPIPMIGVIINGFCWGIVWFMFKLKGINFIGKMTTGSFGKFNALLEPIASLVLFWPGLVIATCLTILQSEGIEG
jgi:hypothetical protein